MIRKDLLAVGLTFLMSSAAYAQPDVIYHNARVITVAKGGAAQAVAIDNGKIVAVGSNQQVRKLAGGSTRVVDLGGRALLPGFYDNHIHLGGPIQPWRHGGWIDVVPEWMRGVDTIPKLQSALAAQVAKTPRGQWITGELAREEWPNQLLPTRHDLDKVSPDHPVYIARGPHTIVVNSKALELAKVTRDTKPSGGEIIHDEKGEPTGKILESARRVVTAAMPESAREGALTPEQQLSNWRTLLRQLVSLGVTSVNVAGVRPDGLKLVQTLYDRWGNELPRMTVQLRVSPGYDSHENAEEGAKVSIREIEAIGDPSKVFNHPKLKMGAVKMSIDGGLSAPVFWSTLPYEGRPPFYGVQRIPAYSFTSVARRAHELGWQLGIHTMGDGAVVMVVDELERILKDRPRANHRHYLHHVAVLPPDDTVKKMANLDINVASQPGFLLALGAFADEALDPLREETQQPAASLVARGVRVSFGSDAGPYGPLAGIYAAVTRRHWDRTIRGPREAVSARDAIAMHTLESAYFNFNEKTVGSIEVGKAADFVVLDRDPTAIDPEQIQHVKVERTIIGGQEIFVSSSATAQR